MDKLTEFYSDKGNIKYLKKVLSSYFYVSDSSLFFDEEDIKMTMEDIIQESFISLYKKDDSYYTNLPGLVTRTVKNKAIDELRRRKRFNTVPLLDEDEKKKDDDFIHPKKDFYEVRHGFNLSLPLSPNEYAEENEVFDIVKRSDISKKSAEAFTLQLQGYKQSEIGEIIGIKKVSVAKRLTKARAGLKKDIRVKSYLEKF